MLNEIGHGFFIFTLDHQQIRLFIASFHKI